MQYFPLSPNYNCDEWPQQNSAATFEEELQSVVLPSRSFQLGGNLQQNTHATITQVYETCGSYFHQTSNGTAIINDKKAITFTLFNSRIRDSNENDPTDNDPDCTIPAV